MPFGGKSNQFKQYDLVQKLKAKQDVGGFAKMLRDSKPSHRCEAARALGEIGGPRAVDPLLKALADDVSSVRTDAATSLGNIRDPKAVDALMGVVRNDGNASARFAAAHALGKIGDPRASEVLVEALKRGNPDSDGTTHVDFAAGDALGMIGGPQVVDGLTGYLRTAADEEDYQIGKSIELLGRIGDQRAVDVLIDFIKDGRGNGLHRNHAVLALDRIGGQKAEDFLDNELMRPKESVRGHCTSAEAAKMLNLAAESPPPAEA